MLEDFKKHTIHYLILFIILALGLLGFWHFSYQPPLQWVVILAVAILYVAWGVVHHLLEGNLNYKIVIEYTSMAALAATLLWIIIGVSS